MATVTIKANATQFITASASAYYTVSAGAIGEVREIIINNTDTTTAYNYTLYNVPSGGSASAGNAIQTAVTIGAGTNYRLPYSLEMPSGGMLQAVANTASKLTITTSALEYT